MLNRQVLPLGITFSVYYTNNRYSIFSKCSIAKKKKIYLIFWENKKIFIEKDFYDLKNQNYLSLTNSTTKSKNYNFVSSHSYLFNINNNRNRRIADDL